MSRFNISVHVEVWKKGQPLANAKPSDTTRVLIMTTASASTTDLQRFIQLNGQRVFMGFDDESHSYFSMYPLLGASYNSMGNLLRIPGYRHMTMSGSQARALVLHTYEDGYLSGLMAYAGSGGRASPVVLHPGGNGYTLNSKLVIAVRPPTKKYRQGLDELISCLDQYFSSARMQRGDTVMIFVLTELYVTKISSSLRDYIDASGRQY